MGFTVIGFDEAGDLEEYALVRAPSHLIVERLSALEDFLSLGIEDYHWREGVALVGELEGRDDVDPDVVDWGWGIVDDLEEEHEAVWG